MKTIPGLGLSLMITGFLMGCTSTDGNANLHNTNTNTGYLTASPTPTAMSTPIMNSNAMVNGGNRMMSNGNYNSNMNTKMNSNVNHANGNRH